jgi:hypothetical protein
MRERSHLAANERNACEPRMSLCVVLLEGGWRPVLCGIPWRAMDEATRLLCGTGKIAARSSAAQGWRNKQIQSPCSARTLEFASFCCFWQLRTRQKTSRSRTAARCTNNLQRVGWIFHLSGCPRAVS